jgi:DHA2 family multidrug resistance protein-like MFS transporter
LATLLLSFTPIVVDATILHITIPSLTLALQASGTDILWIIDIYPLMMAGLLVPMGTLADRVGPKRMLTIGLTLFMLASAIAAFAPSALVLIAARALQAMGGSMVMPAILALIRHLFTDSKERGVALGLWGTVASAGAAIGPIAGGALLEHFWWGSVFLINVPIILALLVLIACSVPEFRTDTRSPWKIGHAIVLILACWPPSMA